MDSAKFSSVSSTISGVSAMVILSKWKDVVARAFARLLLAPKQENEFAILLALLQQLIAGLPGERLEVANR